MLEDIRNHSPIPAEDEIQWMHARPVRALCRVAVLAMIAIGVAVIVAPLQHPAPPATIAQAAAQVPR